MPISSSSATPGQAPPRGLRKPASTTFLQSPSSPSASLTTPVSAGGGWKSIFRIPSSKKLNIQTLKENQPQQQQQPSHQDDLASSGEHGATKIRLSSSKTILRETIGTVHCTPVTNHISQ
ncbi:hypothetical protein M408DRAFT_24527 [Serendipita vermifera MAFF 305830]|uniref:Uncharacterized protein n=1 Tax=Serendipita vermifera MAFF 305830 TaxID=933852 RepID=A0A0C3B659_SERVB|nr:hypothetical protein M408DRAFT_24527 [Serendipita vermifera MAFF 305830]